MFTYFRRSGVFKSYFLFFKEGGETLREVLRREKKYVLNFAEFLEKSRRLQNVLREDPHNGPRGYLIRSLYFDTEYDGDFFDKEFGLETRKKLRLRLYDPEGNSAVLEMKQKQGEVQKKRSLRLRREDALELIAGNYTPLLSCRESFAAECYALMSLQCCRPRTVVQYRRKAFIAQENSIRITFDYEIDATESCFDLFAPKLLTCPVLDRSQAVLEVKYNGFLLTYIQELLSGLEQSELSVSKYCMARRISYYAHL